MAPAYDRGGVSIHGAGAVLSWADWFPHPQIEGPSRNTFIQVAVTDGEVVI
ncbi:MAG: hypothetical protein ACYCO3_16155 [Mycobacteriales bacterium]